MARALEAHIGFSDLYEQEKRLVGSFRGSRKKALAEKVEVGLANICWPVLNSIKREQVVECFEKAELLRPDIMASFGALTIQEEVVLDEIAVHLEAIRHSNRIDRFGREATKSEPERGSQH